MEVLERERKKASAGGLGGNPAGNPNDMAGGPGGMGKKSSSTSQLSAAGIVNWKCILMILQPFEEVVKLNSFLCPNQ